MAGVIGVGQSTQVLTAKSIMADDVVNSASEHIGDIKDLMIDLQRGCIAYAVLDFGGFLGMGSKYFAVPWDSFTVDEDRKELRLNVSREWLENAPGFDKDHWPMSNDEAYYGQVTRYYENQRSGMRAP